MFPQGQWERPLRSALPAASGLLQLDVAAIFEPFSSGKLDLETPEQMESRVAKLERKSAAVDRLFALTPNASLIYEADTLQIKQANDAAAKLYGYTIEVLCTKRVTDLFVPARTTNLATSLSASEFGFPEPLHRYELELKSLDNNVGPYPQQHATGRELTVRMYTFPFDVEGTNSRIALIQDETGQQSTEEALRLSEERYRELFENANDIIFIQDLNGHIVAVNRAAESLTGYSRSELLGQDFSEFLTPATRDSMLDSIRAHLGGSATQRYELPIMPRAGFLRFLEVSSRIIYQGGHPVAIQGIGRDVTDWKSSQQRLQETARELQVKNEALSTALRLAKEATQLKEQFLANTSHELRTPMNGIMGMTDLLKLSSLDSDQREYVEAVSECANDLLTIINDLLDMSQIEAGRFAMADEPYDIEESVRSVIKLASVRASSKHLAVRYTVDADIPKRINGDAVRVRQILTNLVGNAVKFTATGFVEIHLTARTGDGFLRCDVVDSGIGVRESAQERIFEAFVQADGTMKREYGGTGLGLAISKKLVELMGGTIGMRNNTPLAGATFWFEIPLRPSSI